VAHLAHSMIGGGCRVPQDVAPYTAPQGSRCAHRAELVGLERRGFEPARWPA